MTADYKMALEVENEQIMLVFRYGRFRRHMRVEMDIERAEEFRQRLIGAIHKARHEVFKRTGNEIVAFGENGEEAAGG